MSVCITCSSEIAPGAAFCSRCGSPNPESGTAVVESDSDTLRRRLQAALGNDHTVEEMMGEGGFAMVFAVYDRRLSRRIAVKVLRPELTASRSSKQRFVREAESVARLNHPHILPIFSVGEAHNLVWFGMPLVEGETLDARMRRAGRFEEAEAARIGAEIADALAEAHAAGLVHRDIKPLNVMLQGPRGRVLVADFGIAKAAAGSGEQLTGTGVAIGSPHYMSPEQAAGADGVDRRSDIYSLGIVLWQMLAGSLPFEAAESRAVIMQQMTRSLPKLRDRRPDVSAAMSAIIERCTAKQPQDRFQTAEEVATALRGLAASHLHPQRARPLTGALIALSAVGLTLLGVWFASRPGVGGGGEGAGNVLQVSAPATAGPVIAVLPFSVASSGDTAQFGRAAALMLAEALSLRNGVTTIDGNDMLGRWIGEARRNAAPLEEHARFAYGMGANQMIVGNYIASGNTFRLAVTMYDTHDASRLWADEATGSTDSLFAQIDRLAARAALALCSQPAYNPGGICFDTPARPSAPISIAAAASDSAPSLFARITESGEIADIRVERASADAALASRAIEAVYGARFAPARRRGRPVDAWTVINVALRTTMAGDAAGSEGAAAACDDPAVAIRNADGLCYDERAAPRTAPILAVPAACTREPTAATILVRLDTAGTVTGRPELQRPSDCEQFNNAAMAFAQDATFNPARKAGRAVATWALMMVRPASAGAGDTQ